jgi:hypothetical protein
MGSPQFTAAPNHAGHATIYDSPGRKRSMNDTQKPASSTTGRASKGFTDEERAAMKERARELKAASPRAPGDLDGESEVLAKIAEMQKPDRVMAERLHALGQRRGIR